MAVSIAQYVDLLFKKLQGVAKTANAATKSASNESIASPAFLRGDIIWMESNQITATAQAITGIANARTRANSVQCTADNTVPPIGGIRPTWLSNVTYWIPQEMGPTWLPKVFVGPPAAANIEATGTQIFADGIGGIGQYFFDTQAGVLNYNHHRWNHCQYLYPTHWQRHSQHKRRNRLDFASGQYCPTTQSWHHRNC